MQVLTINNKKLNLAEKQDAKPMADAMVANGGDVAFDIETTGLSPRSSNVVMLQFKQRGKRPFIFDARLYSGRERGWLGDLLSPLFSGGVRLLGMNLKFDLEFMMAQFGLPLNGVRVYDVMLAEQVIRGMGTSSARSRGIQFNMGGIAKQYGLPVSKEERNWFVDLHMRSDFTLPFPEAQLAYAVQDVAVLFDIYDAQQPLIGKYNLQPTIDLEMRVEPPTAAMEVEGVLIRPAGWMKVIDRAKREATRLENKLHYGDLSDVVDGVVPVEKIRECVQRDDCFEGLDYHIIAARQDKYENLLIPYEEWRKAREAYIQTIRKEWGDKKGWGEYKKLKLAEYDKAHEKPKKPTLDKGLPNIASPAQVMSALNHMGIHINGASKEELDKHEGEHAVIDLILEFRDSNSIAVKFGEALLDKRDPSSGRWHPSYEQIGADSGRMSSHGSKNEEDSGFNFQQIPSRGKYKDLRHHIVARPGHRLVLADFSNIELRILAELTKKTMGFSALANAFARGEDVHTATARMMFGLGPEVDVRSDAIINGKNLHISWRDIAKIINYGLSYGMGVTRLSLKLHVDIDIAKDLMKLYKNAYDNETRFLNQLKETVKDAISMGKGRVKSKTILGRLRWFDVPTKPTLLGKDKDSVHAYEDAIQEFNKQVSSVKLALANTPIQGTSADITKLAVALWWERYGARKDMRLLGVVHDELIVESEICSTPQAEKFLAEVMDEAQHAFLTRVALPVPEVMHCKYWKH